MYNYMRELHRQFDSKPDCAQQQKELDRIHGELKKHLVEEDRKQLLRLLDTQAVINYETSLESFTAGFHLAWGLLSELSARGNFSYEDTETKRICQRNGGGKEN